VSHAFNRIQRWAAERILNQVVGPRLVGGRRRIELGRYGIEVADAECRQRIERILGAFFGGFELALSEPGRLAAAGEAEEPLYRPFFHEGAATGHGAGDLLRLRSLRRSLERFEEEAVPPQDPFVFLRYVGLGFSLGFRLRSRPRAIERAAESLRERRLRHLVHDGYGFQTGFFRLRRAPGAVACLRAFSGFARTSAFNGLGRSLWFFHMDRPEAAFERAKDFGEDWAAVVGGLGLAAAFTRPDDLSVAYRVAARVSPSERRHFRKGVRIALYCRHSNDAAYLRQCLEGLPADWRVEAESDLAHALAVGERTSGSEEFIEEFHAGCLEGM
jgi:hypothetical protein